ncbi:MAG: SMP-30/gluconolactonase/LRE family protein [Gammaproteobacteria bacterium]|nr:SMP-30/gluconolactonase/LRE family protein [Gammaproteobacteria bacterium]
MNCYDVHDDGSLGDKTVFVTSSQGIPDGLVVDQEGTVWVALADGGHGVAGFAKDGRQRGFIRILEPMRTSVCFGGADLCDLYIVSGSNGTGKEKGGGVHRLHMDVPGVPKAAARVSIP